MSITHDRKNTSETPGQEEGRRVSRRECLLPFLSIVALFILLTVAVLYLVKRQKWGCPPISVKKWECAL